MSVQIGPGDVVRLRPGDRQRWPGPLLLDVVAAFEEMILHHDPPWIWLYGFPLDEVGNQLEPIRVLMPPSALTVIRRRSP